MVANFYSDFLKNGFYVPSQEFLLSQYEGRPTHDSKDSWAASPAKSLPPPAHKPPTGLIPNKHLSEITNANPKQGWV